VVACFFRSVRLVFGAGQIAAKVGPKRD